MKTEKEIWKIIEDCRWESDSNYNRISTELKSLGKETFETVQNFVIEKASQLDTIYEDAWLGRDGGPGIDCSDDSWSDLRYEVVGRGEEFYNSITVDKLRSMAKTYDYSESFCYCFL